LDEALDKFPLVPWTLLRYVFRVCDEVRTFVVGVAHGVAAPPAVSGSMVTRLFTVVGFARTSRKLERAQKRKGNIA